MNNIQYDLSKFTTGNKEETRWDSCVRLGQMIKRSPMQVSSLFKGLKKDDVDAFIYRIESYERPDIQFWVLWKEYKPK